MKADKKVIELMNSLGSDVSKSRPVRFYFYFEEVDAANIFAQRLEGMQFQVEISTSAIGNNWLCLAERNMMPDTDILEGLRNLLTPLAENLDGNFDGWETEILF